RRLFVGGRTEAAIGSGHIRCAAKHRLMPVERRRPQGHIGQTLGVHHRTPLGYDGVDQPRRSSWPQAAAVSTVRALLLSNRASRPTAIDRFRASYSKTALPYNDRPSEGSDWSAVTASTNATH